MRPGSLIGPTIIAIGLVAAALAFAVATALLQDAGGRDEARFATIEARLDAAEAEIRRLDSALASAKSEIGLLRERVAAAGTPAIETPALPLSQDPGFGDHDETEAPTELMKLAKSGFNQGITQPSSRFMIETLGNPRDDYTQGCQAVTNERLRAAMETREAGPIRVTMLRPALASLDRILSRLKQTDPDIYAKLGTAGALCARLIRGSSSAVSNHSWGTAIDLKLQDELDRFADGGTQFGLLIIAEYFNDEGWFWGATYSREDSMHFEVGAETIREWVSQGQI